MRIIWIKGERTTSTLKGKNGGLSVKQEVTKVLAPKGSVV